MYSKSNVTVYPIKEYRILPCGSNGKYSARVLYYKLRSDICRLRRHSPNHMDVLWYERSLGLDETSNSVTIRTYHYGCCYAIGVVAPLRKLP